MATTTSGSNKDVRQLLEEALGIHRAGDLAEAERRYRAVLDADGRNVHALTLLGTLQVQRGNFAEAERVLNLSLNLDPRQPSALNSLGNALGARQRHEEALDCYQKAIALKSDYAIAYNNCSSVLRALGRHSEALANCDKAIALDRNYADAHSGRGDALRELKRFDEAIASYDGALALRPRFPRDHFLKGVALQEASRAEEAVASYDKAIDLKPDYAEAHNNKGNALAQLGQYAEAMDSYERAIAFAPDVAQTYGNRARTLLTLHRYGEACSDYDKAIALKPDDPGFHRHRGDALRRLKRFADAVTSYDQATRLSPDDPNAHYGRALALFELGRLEEASRDIDRVLDLDAGFPYAPGVRLLIKTRLCEWNGLDDARQGVVAAIDKGLCASIPFALLAIDCPPDIRRKCAELYVRDKWPAPSVSETRTDTRAHDRIRLAYLSADFRAHATASLMAGVYEQHDRTRFEVHAVSFGPDDGSEMRARLKTAFEHFIDVRSLDDRDVAALLREREIDIAVDLMGFTDDSRPGILALRPAPIQVNYLGFPGTMGADFIDYIVADRFVIPEEQAQYYAEKVAFLPETYQCNDSKRRIADVTPGRRALGLPDKGFVFCSFNRSFKIAPPVFDLWMRLLHRTERSVLWLLATDAGATANLRREAEHRGIAAERLIFAPIVSLPDHLARQRLADLFLDTLPCGAHTTASEALWAGLPMLTSMGESFAGRVAGSLLHAIGLPELVTHSLPEYEAKALELARNPSALAAIRQKLEQNRARSPLFDTARFTRHLEAAYAHMWERRRRGEPPATFAIPPLN